MKVLSLFDGMSGAQVALQRAGFTVDVYLASEIDRYATKITQKNFPDTVQLGDVKSVSGLLFEGVDLLVGGSPCQGFSFAGKQLNFNDPRSALFLEYVRILQEAKPRYFLLENVKMKKECQDVISGFLGVEPIEINSALVSAQNRKRLYWTNIPNVTQPKDLGIMLKDVLEEDGAEPMYSNIYGGFGENAPRMHAGKSVTIRPSTGGGHIPSVTVRSVVDREKAYCLDANYAKGGNLETYFTKRRRQLVFKVPPLQEMSGNYVQFDKSGKNYKSQDQRAYFPEGKHGALQAHNGAGKVKVYLAPDSYRKLTPVECERLQTFPDEYTEGVSNTQRYKMLGNGFTVDVIAHILSGLRPLVL